MKNEDKYFTTTSFNLAVFLFAKGFELVNISRFENQKRANFVFANRIYSEELIHEFNFGKENTELVMVDARKLFYSSKLLKEKLYQNN